MTTPEGKQTHADIRTYWRPNNLKIGQETYYDDDIWEFDVKTAGQSTKAYRIDWMNFEPKPQWTSTKWKPLLEELKCLFWTLHHDRREGKTIEGGSIARVAASLKDLIPWMIDSGLESLSRIDSTTSWGYVEWFKDHHARERKGKSRARLTTFSTAWQALHILTQAFEQSSALAERGYAPMKEEPYDGLSVFEIAKKHLKLKTSAKLDPIPDHVAIPLIREASRWITERSEDIVRLQQQWLTDVLPLPTYIRRAYAGTRILKNFSFAVDPQTNAPWKQFDEAWTRIDSEDIRRRITMVDIPRRLVSDLIAACLIILQGMTGMRSSDVASLQVEPTPPGQLPSCIETQLSLDGLTEMFLLKGVEQKSAHYEHSWVMGARLVDTQEYPIPVQAVILLDRILAPYRTVAGFRDLVLSTGQSRSMQVMPENVSKISSSWLSNTQREFANNYTAAGFTKHKPSQGKENAFRAQQWRGTFAIFVVRTNKRALGPLATHFNHVDVLMTEHGYIGNDPELLQLVDDARVQLASTTLLNLIDDAEPFAGGLAKHLKEAASDLHHDLGGSSHAERISKIRGMVVDHSLRLHFTDYGICGIAVTPLVARCHQLAGTDDADKERPNFATRRPGVCAGCQNFLVSRDNLPYWRQRGETLRAVEKDQKEARTWRHGRELALADLFVRTLEKGA